MFASSNSLFTLLCAGSLFLAGVAHAREESFAETPEEKALCSAQVYGGMDKISRIKLDGQEKWGHTHHYCDCVRFRYRALKHLGDRRTVNYNLDIAIGGCEYVLKRVPQDHFLRSKIHVDKGRALKLRGNIGAAQEEFAKAIRVNPREVNAYVEQSALERAHGRSDQALETVILGLRHNPGSKVLQRDYLALGGKEPFPEPLDSPEGTVKPAEPDGAQAAPSQATVVEQVTPGDTTVEGPQTSAQSPAGDVTSPVPERGCRFCPPQEIIQRWNESFTSDRPAGAAVDKAR